MAFIQVPAGTNPKFTITAKNADGTPVDLTAVDGYGFVVYKKPSGIIARFSKNSITNWLDLTPVDEANGEFEITIPVEATANADKDKHYAEILIQTTDGGDVFISKNPGGKEFIEIVESPSSSITSLV